MDTLSGLPKSITGHRSQRPTRPRLGGHGHTEDELRYVRRRYLSVDAGRAIVVQIAHVTFSARSTDLWGRGSRAVVSGSTHVWAYDQKLFAEWHSR
ncbi:Tn3 family transposase [Streptomyces sp. NPDC101150]|uniref:Tn3 family transposase n=1 Tax=Streptomyces sp. NPDC101150 TaxID=3366114 RepID=UPI0037F91646